MVLRVLLVFLVVLWPAAAQPAETIGLSLPKSGPFDAVTSKMDFGALMAVDMLNQQGRGLRLVTIDDGCGEAEVDDAASQLADAAAKIVVGPLCFAAGRALADELNAEGGATTVPVVMVDTRNPLLQHVRGVEMLPLYALSPSPTAEAKAVVEKILPRFQGKSYAIVDDGSVYGRGLADAVRLQAEQAGFKPIASANFRPLQTNQIAFLRRLQRSGVQALFIAAMPEDVATIAGDLKTLGYDWPLGTAEAARLIPFTEGASNIPNGLMMVRARDVDRTRAAGVLRRLNDDAEPVEDSTLIGYALMELAAGYLSDPASGLIGRSFPTILGPIVFDETGRADLTPFGLYTWNGTEFAIAGDSE